MYIATIATLIIDNQHKQRGEQKEPSSYRHVSLSVHNGPCSVHVWDPSRQIV